MLRRHHASVRLKSKTSINRTRNQSRTLAVAGRVGSSTATSNPCRVPFHLYRTKKKVKLDIEEMSQVDSGQRSKQEAEKKNSG